MSRLDLPTNDKGYTLDIYGKPVHFENNPYLSYANTKLPLTQEHVQEIYKCSQDVFYFIENYCKIFVLGKGYQLPKLRIYQRNLIQHYIDNSFSNVLAGRQTGKSTTTIMVMLWYILFRSDTIAGFAANKWDMAKENLDRFRSYFELLPIWLKPGIKTWNKTFVSLENGSKVYTSTATETAFRGLGIELLWVDEISFIKNWYGFVSSVFPTIASAKNPKVMYTTTPKGLDHFYSMWQEAENGKSLFKNFKVNWWEVEGRDDNWKDTMISTLPGGEQEFLQEWAAEFMGSSKTLVDVKHLQSLNYEDFELDTEYLSNLRIYKRPEENHRYIMSIDGAKQGKDKTAIQIIDISKFPFEQVASLDTKINHVIATASIGKLGKYYNNAFIIAENNEGAGTYIADTLYHAYEYENIYKQKNKDNFGFQTNRKTRPTILNFLKLFIEKNKLIVRDKTTIDQLFTFIEKNGKYQADNGKFDDLVMCLAISFAPFLDLNIYDDYEKFLDSLDMDINSTDEENQEIIEMLNIGYFDDGIEEPPRLDEGIFEYDLGFNDNFQDF